MTPQAAFEEEIATKTQEQELSQEASLVITQSHSIKIVDQNSYDRAAEFLRDKIKPFLKKAAEFFDGNIKKAHELHKSLLAQKTSVTSPVENAERAIKGELSRFIDEEERKRQEAERKARAEQERQHQEQLLQEAVQAEEQGASEEEKQAILETPNFAPAPTVTPTFEKAKGISAPKKWKAELVDLRQLCKAIAEGKAPINLVQHNVAACNALARAQGSELRVPGLKAVEDRWISVR